MSRSRRRTPLALATRRLKRDYRTVSAIRAVTPYAGPASLREFARTTEEGHRWLERKRAA